MSVPVATDTAPPSAVDSGVKHSGVKRLGTGMPRGSGSADGSADKSADGMAGASADGRAGLSLDESALGSFARVMSLFSRSASWLSRAMDEVRRAIVPASAQAQTDAFCMALSLCVRESQVYDSDDDEEEEVVERPPVGEPTRWQPRRPRAVTTDGRPYPTDSERTRLVMYMLALADTRRPGGPLLRIDGACTLKELPLAEDCDKLKDETLDHFQQGCRNGALRILRVLHSRARTERTCFCGPCPCGPEPVRGAKCFLDRVLLIRPHVARAIWRQRIWANARAAESELCTHQYMPRDIASLVAQYIHPPAPARRTTTGSDTATETSFHPTAAAVADPIVGAVSDGQSPLPKRRRLADGSVAPASGALLQSSAGGALVHSAPAIVQSATAVQSAAPAVGAVGAAAAGIAAADVEDANCLVGAQVMVDDWEEPLDDAWAAGAASDSDWEDDDIRPTYAATGGSSPSYTATSPSYVPDPPESSDADDRASPVHLAPPCRGPASAFPAAAAAAAAADAAAIHMPFRRFSTASAYQRS
jgi:hypothetical protein